MTDWSKYNRYQINARLTPDLYKRLGIFMKNNDYTVSQALTNVLNQKLPKLPND